LRTSASKVLHVDFIHVRYIICDRRPYHVSGHRSSVVPTGPESLHALLPDPVAPCIIPRDVPYRTSPPCVFAFPGRVSFFGYIPEHMPEISFGAHAHKSFNHTQFSSGSVPRAPGSSCAPHICNHVRTAKQITRTGTSIQGRQTSCIQSPRTWTNSNQFWGRCSCVSHRTFCDLSEAIL
jgi:hypothetical protein